MFQLVNGFEQADRQMNTALSSEQEKVASRVFAWLARLKLCRVIGTLLILGIATRFATLALLRIHPVIEFAELESIARSLAIHGTFADPYAIPTGPTAHHAPVYPLLLSFIFRVFGYGNTAAYAMAAMNIFFASLQFALLPVLADVAKVHRAVGVIAGFIGALLPYRIMREIRWETTLSALAIVVLVIVTTHWWRLRQSTRAHSFVIGASWGMGMLCCPVLLPVFAVMLLLFANSSHRRRWTVSVVMAAIGMTLTVLPWTIRNYRALGGVSFVRSNFGLEMDLANNSEAHLLFADNVSVGFPDNYYHRHHPWASREQAERVERIGEIAFNRECLRRAVGWAQMHPRDFTRLTVERFLFFWFSFSKTQKLKDVVLVPWTLLAGLGLWVALRQHRPLGLLVLSLWIGYPLVYYLAQADTRYRYPVDWSFALLAVYFLTQVVWQREAGARRQNRHRIAH